jgi:RimJ/RimL family protein N-acetyltransferase
MLLTPPREADWPTVQKWHTDEELFALIRIDPPRPDMHALTTIIRLDDDTPVGWIDLFNVDPTNVKAEMAMATPDERGRELAGEAADKFLALAFEAWGFNRITCRILASNQYAIKCAELFGFIREGVERQAIYRDGKFEDVIVFAMLRDDFRKKVMGHDSSDTTVHSGSFDAGTARLDPVRASGSSPAS